jgi:hypothetical protein
MENKDPRVKMENLVLMEKMDKQEPLIKV